MALQMTPNQIRQERQIYPLNPAQPQMTPAQIRNERNLRAMPKGAPGVIKPGQHNMQAPLNPIRQYGDGSDQRLAIQKPAQMIAPLQRPPTDGGQNQATLAPRSPIQKPAMQNNIGQYTDGNTRGNAANPTFRNVNDINRQGMTDGGTGGAAPPRAYTPENVRSERFPGVPYTQPNTQYKGVDGYSQAPNQYRQPTNQVARYTDGGNNNGVNTGGVNENNSALLNGGGNVPGQGENNLLSGDGTYLPTPGAGGQGSTDVTGGNQGQYSDLYSQFGEMLKSINSSNELYTSQIGGLREDIGGRLGQYDQQMQGDRAALQNLMTPEHMQMLINQQMTNLDPQYQQGLQDIQGQLPEALVRQRTMDERRGFGASTEASNAAAGIEGDAIRAGSDLYNSLLGEASGNASNFLNQQLAGQGQLAGLSAAQYGAGMENFGALGDLANNQFGAADTTQQRTQGIYGDQAGLIEANQNQEYRNSQIGIQQQQLAQQASQYETEMANGDNTNEDEYNIVTMTQQAMDPINAILASDSDDASKQREIDALINMWSGMYGGRISDNLRQMAAGAMAGTANEPQERVSPYVDKKVGEVFDRPEYTADDTWWDKMVGNIDWSFKGSNPNAGNK